MHDEKGARPQAPGNVTPDGDYVVGKGKPPESGKFRAGDGRQRGRRRKGTRNLATDLRAELDARVTVNVGGVSRKISRQQAILMRLADNATKGQNPAIAMALEYQQRLVDPILLREQETQTEEEQYDYSRLTVDEQFALEQLLLKAAGQKPPDYGPEIIVKPFDWHKKYEADRVRNAQISGEIIHED